MAIVNRITKEAENFLKLHNIRFQYGYGDAYHFGDEIPQKTSVDIQNEFVIDGTTLFVKNCVLDLKNPV